MADVWWPIAERAREVWKWGKDLQPRGSQLARSGLSCQHEPDARRPPLQTSCTIPARHTSVVFNACMKYSEPAECSLVTAYGPRPGISSSRF